MATIKVCGSYYSPEEPAILYIPGSNGLYKYGFTAPLEVQRMIADVKSLSPIAYGTEDISVTDWTKDIATIESAPPPTPKARFKI